MNKKNYIKPIAMVFACNPESLLAGNSNSIGVTTNTGGKVPNLEYGGSTNNSGLIGSKDNSGLLDWDDEEE